MEIWKTFKNNNNYKISNKGRIFSNHKFKKFNDGILKPFNDGNGYLIIKIDKKKYKVHRLVAEYFLKNDDTKNKTEVNHIDLNTFNNDYKNLEWCTPKENINHLKINKGITNQFNKKYKEICCYDMNGNFLKKFNSELEAAKFYNFKNSKNKYSTAGIQNCCKGNSISYKNIIFKYYVKSKFEKKINVNFKGSSLKRKITSFNIEKETYKDFESISEAAIELNIRRSDISSVLTNRQLTAKGFKFKYRD
ncbi:MAG: NUMOD4 domain-containing protein [Methanobacteriaceae archaeon]